MPSPASSAHPPRLKEPLAPKLPTPLNPAELPEHGPEDDGMYRSLEFTGTDMASHRADAVDFEGCRFTDARLSGMELRRAGFCDVEMERCDLSNMAAGASVMQRTRVSASRLTGMSWSECVFRDVVFDACRMDLAGFRFSTFKNVVFRDCTMLEANFQNADLRGARFERCELTGAQFSNAQMEGVRFTDCALVRINGVTSLKGATITSRDAQGLVYSLAGAMGITIEG
ncbi:pentapeptide repeat-containing protein [Planomonospora sp. ID91781]|uniref:pentapeptide repeat-containing protein n=1 Tax=Planomonospora sp. ID91781 TaxID=2738135 RepID=UPI0018C3EB75|nr:pentapeptide repeat-containing protein [Planomonospora sp. ID91781]MBG0823354.1 pentapeptide repeat-containing protein [Planomonospora sp. ID91781]